MGHGYGGNRRAEGWIEVDESKRGRIKRAEIFSRGCQLKTRYSESRRYVAGSEELNSL